MTLNSLKAVLGASKHSTCYRWICLARDLDEKVLDHIRVNNKNLFGSYIVDNKFFLGRGEAARFKLTPEFAMVALDQLFETLEGGKIVSAKEFIAEFCNPAKALESWQKQQIGRFGRVASEFPAFKRVVSGLKSENGRQKLLLCLSQRLPISGREGHVQHGIEEAHAVVLEMQKMKAGSDPEAHPKTGGVSPAAGGGSGDSSGAPGEAGDGEVAMDIDSDDGGDLLLESQEEQERQDPIMAKAEALADVELTHVAVHVSRDEFKKDVEGRVLASHKTILVIEAPSSKAKVFADLLKLAEGLKLTGPVLVPVDSRVDLLSTVMAALTRAFPKRSIFIVQFGNENQTAYRRGTFGVYMPGQGATINAVPAFISLSGVRAKATEGLRLRCMDPKCSKRGVEVATEDADPAAVNDELHEDDRVLGEFDPRDIVEEAELDEGDIAVNTEQMMTGELDEEGKHGKYRRNLFPFASPVEQHSRVLHQLVGATGFTHLIVLSRTAHPGLLVAARECKLEILALIEGSNDHCVAHGRELLRNMLCGKHYKAAKEQVGSTGGVKRVRASSIPFILAKAPASQPIHIRDVEPDVATSTWRCGFNKRPLNMEEKMVALIQKELLEHALMLSKVEGVLTLCTLKARREGEMICPVSGLLFDTLASLERFLSEGGNKVMSDKVIRVDGVILDESGGVSPLYMAVSGAAMHMRHFAGVRKGGPNAVITVDTAKGAADGFLSLTVSTRNQAGVAARSPIVVNYGNEYDLSYKVDSDEPDAKRFSGALQQYFAHTVDQEDVSQSVAEPQQKAEQKQDSTGEEKKKERKEEGEKEEPKKKKEGKEEEGVKKEEGTKKEVKKDAGEAAAAEPNTQKNAGVDKSLAGSTLATQAEPFPFKVTYQEQAEGQAAAQMCLDCQIESNKKLPPGSVLWVLKKDGKLGNAATGLHWAFSNTKTYLDITLPSIACALSSLLCRRRCCSR